MRVFRQQRGRSPAVTPSVTKATSVRLLLAQRLAHELSKNPRVLAVIAMGSVALNRCSRDSDLDLAVITRDLGERCRIETRLVRKIAVDYAWLPRQAAVAIAKGGRRDAQGLRDASRLGLGLPLYDPNELAPTLRRHAVSLLPDRGLIVKTLESVSLTLARLARRADLEPARQWDLLRSIYDSLAFVTLQLHPIRYHKPKWVVTDLRNTGHPELMGDLLDVYFARMNSESRARRAVRLGRVFLDALSGALNLPGYQKILDLGFTRQYAEFSYVCRALADADSLLVDGLYREAQYTAKFAIRMGVSLSRALAPTAPCTEPLPLLAEAGIPELAKTYRTVFSISSALPPPDKTLFQRCQDHARSCSTRSAEIYHVTQGGRGARRAGPAGRTEKA